MRKTTFGMLAVFMCAALTVAAGAARALTIDSFATAQVASSTVAGTPGFSNLQSNSSIGGFRSLRAIKTSGGGATTAEVFQGSFSHSLDAGTKGATQVVWDGDTVANNLNFTGLGDLDLSQDGGTALVLSDVSVDPGLNSLPIRVTVRFYSAADSSGTNYAEIQRVFTNQEVVSNGGVFPQITLPFSQFQIVGSFDFRHVGAITLSVPDNDDPAPDVSIGQIGTNGSCALVPNAQGRVLDDCGVCGGTNQDKDSCGVCFGNNAAVDQCGVCFGNNRDLDDCGVCNGNNQSKDLCGICGGNNTACADCKGIPNGSAQRDVCNVCAGDGKSCIDCKGVINGPSKVDQCGVCEGDGRSCLKCNNLNIQSTLDSLRAKTEEQYQTALFFLQRLDKSDRKFSKASRAVIERLHQELVDQINGISPLVSQCEANPFCIESAGNVDKVEDYQIDVQDLFEISVKILNRKVIKGPGKCRGPLKECIQRNKSAAKGKKTLTQLAQKLRKENIQLSKEVPLTFSVCS